MKSKKNKIDNYKRFIIGMIGCVITVLCVDFYWFFKDYWWRHFFSVGFLIIGWLWGKWIYK